MNIEDYIPFRKENAVTRTQLVIRTGMSDREVRIKIEKARKSGIPIINAQDGKGYYRPTIDEYLEARQQYLQEKSRAMKILKGNKGLGKWLCDVEHGRLRSDSECAKETT